MTLWQLPFDPYAARRHGRELAPKIARGEITTDEALEAMRQSTYIGGPPTFSFPIITTDNTRNPNVCAYCGNTGSAVNLRGGLECAGCGHPK